MYVDTRWAQCLFYPHSTSIPTLPPQRLRERASDKPHTPPSSTQKHRAHGGEGYYSSTAVGSVYKWHSAYGDTAPRTLSACGRGVGGLAIYLGEELLVVLRALHEVLHILHSLYGVHLGEHLTYRPHTLLGSRIL